LQFWNEDAAPESKYFLIPLIERACLDIDNSTLRATSGFPHFQNLCFRMQGVSYMNRTIMIHALVGKIGDGPTADVRDRKAYDN
jgi:hypothetical protein